MAQKISQRVFCPFVRFYVLWNPTSNKIYTANANGNSVSIIDGSTHALLTSVPTGSKPRRLNWNGINNKIYSARWVEYIFIIDG